MSYAIESKKIRVKLFQQLSPPVTLKNGVTGGEKEENSVTGGKKKKIAQLGGKIAELGGKNSITVGKIA